jgi:hypothetical protein
MDIYRIGVSIALTNNIGSGLALISRQLLGIHATTGAINSNFGRWATAIGGVAGVMGGAAMLKGLAKITDHGTKLLDQQDQLRRNGLTQNEILKMQGEYYGSIAKMVPTSTAAEYLKTVKELRAVTGSTVEAARLAPKALQVDALLSNTFGTETKGEYYKLLRSSEMKGISTDEAKREEFVDKAFSYITAFGGKLTARDYQTMARRGGAAFMNMKPEAMGPMSVLAADLGGESAGTAMMTFHQLMTGANTMSKQQGQMWQQLGLLDMSKVTKTGFGGGRLQLDLGAVKGSLEHAGDLPGWVHDVLWPAIEKEAGGDPAKRDAIIGKMAPNRNASKLIHMFGEEGFADQIKKDLGIAGQVKGIPDAYKGFVGENPAGAKQAFHDQYESMMQAIGAPLMQAALPVMKAVTEMFEGLGRFANNNPEAIKQIGGVLAAIAAALVIMGGVAIVSLLGLPAAIAGLAAGLAALVAFNWEALKSGLVSVKDAFIAFESFKFEMVKAGFDMITNAISNFVSSLVEFAKSIPGMVLKGLGIGKGEGGPSDKGGASGSWAPTSFSPGQIKPKATPISMSLNVDGRTLAQAISEQLEFLYEHATGAPSYDGTRRFIPADSGIMGT